jgi:uncharacterized protein YutD
MEKIMINEIQYEVIVNERDAIDKDILKEKITDYFDNYDYIVGDWAYGKVRLKGFYDSKNKNCKKFNDIAHVDDYIKNNCAYGCRWFELKKCK